MGSLSPIHTLPSEILGKIFHLGSASPQSHKPPFPLLVTSVCRSWRLVAISTPDVWTRISVFPTTSQPAPLVGLWLERSKACLLHIEIFYGYALDPTSQAGVDQALSLLLQHSRRWKSVLIVGRYTNSAIHLLSRAELTHLDSVTLHRYNNHRPDSLYAPVASQVISLKHATIQETKCPWKLTGLRSLFLSSIRNVAYTELVDILSSSPFLTSLSLVDVEISGSAVDDSLTPIELPYLSSLALTFSSTPPLPVFAHILLPNIEVLELSGHQTPPSLGQFFGQQHVQWAKLCTLRLVSLYIRPDLFDSEFLIALRSLENLEFIDTPLELALKGTVQPSLRPRTLSIGTGFRQLRQVGPPNTQSTDEFPLPARTTFFVPRLKIEQNTWPNLKRVSVDSISQSDARWLFGLVASKDRLVIRLSQRFRRHITAHATEPYGMEWLRKHCAAVEDL